MFAYDVGFDDGFKAGKKEILEKITTILEQGKAENLKNSNENLSESFEIQRTYLAIWGGANAQIDKILAALKELQ